MIITSYLSEDFPSKTLYLLQSLMSNWWCFYAIIIIIPIMIIQQKNLNRTLQCHHHGNVRHTHTKILLATYRAVNKACLQVSFWFGLGSRLVTKKIFHGACIEIHVECAKICYSHLPNKRTGTLIFFALEFHPVRSYFGRYVYSFFIFNSLNSLSLSAILTTSCSHFLKICFAIFVLRKAKCG